MIFEVPIDHFPAQKQATRPKKPMRLSCQAIQSKEVSQAIEAPASPSVRKTPFTFSASMEKRNTIRAAMPPLKRALTSPALPVQHLNVNNLRKSSTASSQNSRTSSVTDLFRSEILKMPVRLLQHGVSLQQLT